MDRQEPAPQAREGFPARLREAMLRAMIDDLKADLKRDEGCVLHAYQDHLGFWTIGYGRLIDEQRGGRISQDEAELLLENDIARVIDGLDRLVPWWNTLPAPARRALANMAFQLGLNGVSRFRKMLAALERQDFETAAREALDSRWATQTPNRAGRIAALYRSAAAEPGAPEGPEIG